MNSQIAGKMAAKSIQKQQQEMEVRKIRLFVVRPS
jgi:hypothetical protein